MNGLYVEVGKYPEYKRYDINLKECGLKFKPTEIQIHFNSKCFSNKYINKTILDVEGVAQQTQSVDSRIFKGRNAGHYEAPWALYLDRKEAYLAQGGCSAVLITFQWVLTAAHCYKFG